MKKLFLILGILCFLTSCGVKYDVNGTYSLDSGDMGFNIVICDNVCMMEVTSINEEGGEGFVVLDGTVSTEDEFVIITIDKDKQIDGNMFQFVYRDDSLINTSDNSVLKKITPDSILPSGRYVTQDGEQTIELDIQENVCEITVKSVNEVGQTAEVSDSGVVSAEGNIVTAEFESRTLRDGIYRFIYNSDSDVLMDTTDRTIYKKITEEE